jgi:hypothetical protein
MFRITVLCIHTYTHIHTYIQDERHQTWKEFDLTVNKCSDVKQLCEKLLFLETQVCMCACIYVCCNIHTSKHEACVCYNIHTSKHECMRVYVRMYICAEVCVRMHV